MPKERRVSREDTPVTGRTDGLSQDYNTKLHQWFASRIDARYTVRRWFGDQTVKRKDKQ